VAEDATELLVASNRLPVEVERRDDQLSGSPSPGGLASALHGCLAKRGGSWIGWPGLAGPVDLAEADVPELAYELVPVELSETELANYYEGFANEILWPLFHDLHAYCDFDPAFWETYRDVNRRFAEALTEEGSPASWLWVQDYHLITVGDELGALGDERPTGFFLHTPFPPAETLERLPWHRQLLEALPSYDLVGVQTRRDVANLREAATRLADGVAIEVEDQALYLVHEDERAEIGVFPISIDTAEVEAKAARPTVEARADEIRQARPREHHTYIVGVERLDYTKGTLERLRAFERLLEDHPELAGEVTLFQHVNPSREGIPQYEELRDRIDRAVGRTNAEHGTVDWQPIRYTYGQLDFEEILALYRVADVALVTSLIDGMNLVAKEYCAADVDEAGVLVLSKFAGAAEELCDDALVVNPHDVERTAGILYEACQLAPTERARRMRNLRAYLREHDVHRWATSFLDRLDPSRDRDGPTRAARVTFPGALRRPSEEDEASSPSTRSPP
jgi:trehalose 6-phosphate synthase